MESGLIVALELALVLGGVLAFAVWELLKLRRYRRRDAVTEKPPAGGEPRA
jgi:hypothetical protein